MLTALAATLLLAASSGEHPYGFYIVLRLVVTVGAAYWALRVYREGLRGWAWAFAAVALLMNPLLPIRMQRTQWQPIDLWLGILLLVWCGFSALSQARVASWNLSLDRAPTPIWYALNSQNK